jgi:hypothetical protein
MRSRLAQVFVTLLQFLVYVIGQLDDSFAPLRLLTVFYYYRPQEMILGKPWVVTLSEWTGGEPLAAVPFGAGLVGYAMALWTFSRRDIPTLL